MYIKKLLFIIVVIFVAGLCYAQGNQTSPLEINWAELDNRWNNLQPLINKIKTAPKLERLTALPDNSEIILVPLKKEVFYAQEIFFPDCKIIVAEEPARNTLYATYDYLRLTSQKEVAEVSSIITGCSAKEAFRSYIALYLVKDGQVYLVEEHEEDGRLGCLTGKPMVCRSVVRFELLGDSIAAQVENIMEACISFAAGVDWDETWDAQKRLAVLKMATHSRYDSDRDQAVRSLQKFGKPAIDTIVESLLRDESWCVRKSAAADLSNMKDITTVSPLIDALGDENPDVVCTVIFALGNIGSPMAVLPLLRFLKSPHSYLRQAAAFSLDKLEWRPQSQEEKIVYLIASQKWYELEGLGKPAVAFLEEMLEDEDSHIRQQAADVLKKIQGR